MSQVTEIRRALLNPHYDQQPRVLEERRTALYFANPYGTRPSEYEQVLLHAQPNPDWIGGGIGLGGWTTAFPGGRGAWENYSTEAKSSDWFVFRDPGGRWQRPYVAEKADGWREFQRLVSSFTGQRAYRGWDDDWTERGLREHFGALALHEYAAFMALAAPIRDCLSDTLRAALVTSALDFLDTAQLIQAEKVYLAQVLPGFDPSVAPSRALFTGSPIWQGPRRFVERLWGETYDHIELAFALYVLHEPLSGRLLRQEFFARQAPLHGDAFTPRLLGPAQRAADAARSWVGELFERALGQDPKFGAYNQLLFRYWAEDWLPLELASLGGALGLWRETERLRGQPGLARAALERVVGDWVEQYAPLFQPQLDAGELVAAALAAEPAPAPPGAVTPPREAR